MTSHQADPPIDVDAFNAFEATGWDRQAAGYDAASRKVQVRRELNGTVRTSVLLLRQPEQTRRNIRVAFDRLVLPYRRGDSFEFPVSVKLAHGRKPAR